MSSKSKWVYLFDEVDQAEKYVGDDWEAVRGLLGGRSKRPAAKNSVMRKIPCWSPAAREESFPCPA
jgi:pyruvate,orthophosphate dikinase